jgi:CheY-like chemotaxis protein
MHRTVVVDDRPDTLAGRVLWLSSIPQSRVSGMSFRQALDPDTDWSQVDIAVLDGRDDRDEDEITVPTQGGPDHRTHDRFLGVRVAQQIRATRSRTQIRIVLISAYARDNDVLARRCQEAGVDFLYSVHELTDAQDFLTAVLTPDDRASPTVDPGTWRRVGLTGPPDFNAAIEAAEGCPAGHQIAFDLPAKRFAGTGHQQRVLRQRLGVYLRIIAPVTSGPRDRGISKRLISLWLRRALGYGSDNQS